MGQRVPSVLTRWAEPWNHNQFCVRFDALLKALGVTSKARREKMIAHAVVATGWRQNVWCYNPWGVKANKSWAGDWYTKTTQEDDGTGNLYTIEDDAWRAFGNWAVALRDYEKRISPNSERYGDAAFWLDKQGPIADKRFWLSLGKGGYYTDTTKPESWFPSIVRRVRHELVTASQEDLQEAADWAREQPGVTGRLGIPQLGIVGAACLVLAILAWAVLKGGKK